MRKRLRKKLRLGEFRELGFALGFRIGAPWGSKGADEFIDAFLAEAVEPQGLGFLGGGRDEWTGFVTAFGRRSVTPSQRDAVLAWLRAHEVAHAVRAGPLVDAWHAPEAAYEPPAV